MARPGVFKHPRSPRAGGIALVDPQVSASVEGPGPAVDGGTDGPVGPRPAPDGEVSRRIGSDDGSGFPHVVGGEVHRGFWLTHMRIGFGVFLAETVVVLGYLGTTPHGPHRPLLWIVAASWLVLAAVNLWLVRLVAAKAWRATFSAGWTVLSAFAVGAVADIDGGLRSPMLILLFLPISFAGWAFSPAAAAACGASSLASLAFVVATNHVPGAAGNTALMLGAVLAGSSVLSVAAARNRVRRERHEAVLADTIVEMAATDGLTGCAVHRVFHQRFRDEVARSQRHGHSLSLVLIDLDNFKQVNDTYGHLVGDHVLAAFGAALLAHSRSFDVVGRLGGDEFAVLMPDTEPSAAAALAERIRSDVPVVLEVPVTISVGVSGLDRSVSTTEQMFDDADFALYEVKRSGRDAVAVRFPSSATHEPTP